MVKYGWIICLQNSAKIILNNKQYKKEISMKKITIAIIVATLTMSTATIAGENLLKNGDMEKASNKGAYPLGWGKIWKSKGAPKALRDTLVKKSGKASLCLDTNSEDTTCDVSQLIDLNGNQQIKISGDILAKGKDIKECQIAIQCFDKNWKTDRLASCFLFIRSNYRMERIFKIG